MTATFKVVCNKDGYTFSKETFDSLPNLVKGCRERMSNGEIDSYQIYIYRGGTWQLTSRGSINDTGEM